MDIKAPQSAEFFLIEDQNQEEHDDSFSYQLFPAQISCIRSGDIDALKLTFTEDFDSYYRTALMGDDPHLPLVLAHVCGTMMIIACEGGLPLSRSAAVSTKYLKTALGISDIDTFLACMKQMMTDYTQEVFMYKRFNSGSAVVNRCMRYIYEHTQEPISLSSLVNISGYSPSRLQHLFKEHTGLSISDYIRREKTLKACLFLRHTDLSCAQISQKLAYGSQSYFIRQFKKEMGMTPARYRKKEV